MDPSDNIKKYWQGFANVRYFFVFGDSYSAVGYGLSSRTHPCEENPLGVPFPGTTSCEPSKPNWVGHLITDHGKLAYDYAIGGQRVEGAVDQITKVFLAMPVGRPDRGGVPWDASNSLFITWIGINDVQFPDCNPSDKLTRLFEAQSKLYDAGARNFLFLNVPPTPRVSEEVARTHKWLINRNKKCSEWNALLPHSIREFTSAHPDATAFTLDAHALFTDILGGPERYGFPKEAGRERDGVVYVDHVHPTSAVHAIVAREVVK
ncbi:hypothetical protein FRB99_001986, partial [Tulasnella sp. 403]